MSEELELDLQKLEITKLNEKAENAVAVAATAATGAIPISFANAPLLIGEQVHHPANLLIIRSTLP